MDNEFDVGNKPHVFGQWPACALAFYRRDIAPLPNVLTASATDADLFAGRLLSDGFPLDAAFTHRLQTRMGAPRSQPALARALSSPYSAVWKTPQSEWDCAKRRFDREHAPFCRACRLYGRADRHARPRHVCAHNRIFRADRFPAWTACRFDASRHLLLTLTARAENTGMVMNPGRTSVTNPGRTPILMEPVQGVVTLRAGSGWQAYALDAQGRRTQSLPLATSGTQTQLKLVSPPALWIEFVR